MTPTYVAKNTIMWQSQGHINISNLDLNELELGSLHSPIMWLCLINLKGTNTYLNEYGVTPCTIIVMRTSLTLSGDAIPRLFLEKQFKYCFVALL